VCVGAVMMPACVNIFRFLAVQALSKLF